MALLESFYRSLQVERIGWWNAMHCKFYIILKPQLLQPLGRAKIVAIFWLVAISSSCYLLLVVIEALQKSRLLQFFRCNNRGLSVQMIY